MIIRRERPRDVPAVRQVQHRAFASARRPDPVEPGLLDALRADPGWLPRLSLVAEDGGAVVGHVVCTRGTAGGRPALGLGPIGVLPGHQGRGAGTALLHAVLAAAEALDEPLVALLGDPALYSRFGFRPAAELGLGSPDPAWGRHFQARALTAHDPERHRGAFRYAAPFDAL